METLDKTERVNGSEFAQHKNGFKAKVSLEGEEAKFNLFLDPEELTKAQLDIIYNAIVKNEPVYVMGEYKVRDGKVERAKAKLITIEDPNAD